MDNSILVRLKNLIDSEENSLDRYRATSNPKQAYIDLVSARIDILVSICHELKSVKYLDYWRETEFLIGKILEQDPLVGEVLLFIGINDAGGKNALIHKRSLIRNT